MNWLSIAIVVVIGVLTWRSYRSGFIRELVSLAAVILAVPVAGILYDDLYPKVHPIVDNVALANLISFVSLFAGVIVAGQVISHLLHQVAAALNLGAVDKIAGGAFGLLKGVLVCQVLLIVLGCFTAWPVGEGLGVYFGHRGQAAFGVELGGDGGGQGRRGVQYRLADVAGIEGTEAVAFQKGVWRSGVVRFGLRVAGKRLDERQQRGHRSDPTPAQASPNRGNPLPRALER